MAQGAGKNLEQFFEATAHGGIRDSQLALHFFDVSFAAQESQCKLAGFWAGLTERTKPKSALQRQRARRAGEPHGI